MATVKGVMKKIEEREELAALEAAAAEAAAEDAVEDLLEAANNYAGYTNKLLEIVEEIMAPLNRIIHIDRAGVDLSAEKANDLAEALDDVSEKHAWLFDAMDDAGIVLRDEDGRVMGDEEAAEVKAKEAQELTGAKRAAAVLRTMIAQDLGVVLPH